MKGSAARLLLAKPWPLIPALDDGNGKRCIRKWKHLQDVPESAEYDDVDAELWAVPTGKGTGVVVLDFDGAEGAETLERCGLEPHVRTGSGGYHIYVARPAWPVKTCARVLPGMDVRGDGGVAYVVGRSAKGAYEILRPLAPYPVKYVPLRFAECIEPARPHRGGGTKAAPFTLQGRPGLIGTLAFLDRTCERVRHAPEGERNGIFNSAVFTIAGLVAAGELEPGFAKSELIAAAEVMAPGWSCSGVMTSAWEAGEREPWRVSAARIEVGE